MKESKDSDERRNEFINVAEQLFKENGIVDTTVTTIVNQMNVAKGLFYYYFRSKDDVIDAISDRYNNNFKQKLQKCAEQSSSFDEKLRSFLKETFLSFKKMWKELKGKRPEVDLTMLSSRTMDEAKETASDALRKLLQEGNDLGILHVPNPKRYAEAIIGGMSDLAKHAEADTKEILDMIERLIKGNGKDDTE